MDRRRFIVGTTAASAYLSMRARAAESAAVAKPQTAPVEALTLQGRKITLAAPEIEDLRRALRGPLLVRSDAGYDQVRRVWNAAIDRRPALIARCLGAADVIQCVKFARSHDLLTAVRAGGHSSAGRSVCDDGLMIDLSLMRGVRVDPAARTAQVAGGSLLGDLDREAQAFGLVVTAGTVSHTGVAGLTLGGGMGTLVRQFGLTIDSLESVDVVTADGSFVRASSQENADLFWATRGGGGNFGIVTEFRFRLHPFGPGVVVGELVFDYTHARKVLGLLGELAPAVPDDGSLVPVLIATPDGRRVLVVGAGGATPEAANRNLEPLRKLAPVMVDRVRVENYVAQQSKDDEAARHGQFGYIKSGFLTRLGGDEIDALMGGIEDWKLPLPQAIPVAHLGGAMARVPGDATAFGFRDALYAPIIGFNWSDPEQSAEVLRWARALWKNLEPHTRGSYINMHSADDQKRVVDAFGPNYLRLTRVKRQWDPTNFFRLNANIEPAKSSA